MKRPPVCRQDGKVAFVALRDPGSGKIGGFVPQTPLFGATSAVLRYTAVSRVVATIAGRWSKMGRPGCFDDFGVVATGSTIRRPLEASAALKKIPGFELKAVLLG